MTSTSSSVAKRISPLARKMARAKGIELSSLKGSGPRGKVMSADVAKPAASSPEQPASDLPIAKIASKPFTIKEPTKRTERFYIYEFGADMSLLAAISTPIAVQCEQILGARYCLFDYVVRASVKAFTSLNNSPDKNAGFDISMITDKGAMETQLPDAVKKTIYQIAQSRHLNQNDDAKQPDESFRPDLYVCDAGTEIDNLSPRIKDSTAAGMVLIGGTSPKTGIEAGRPVQKIILPITVYIEVSALEEQQASKIADEFRSLLENPVLLLF